MTHAEKILEAIYALGDRFASLEQRIDAMDFAKLQSDLAGIADATKSNSTLISTVVAEQTQLLAQIKTLSLANPADQAALDSAVAAAQANLDALQANNAALAAAAASVPGQPPAPVPPAPAPASSATTAPPAAGTPGGAPLPAAALPQTPATTPDAAAKP